MKSQDWRVSGLLAGCLFLAITGCRTHPETTTETSVRPGINAELLKPDLEVSQWVERFEREGREIYDQQREIVQAIGIRRGSTVADLGAGTGLFTPLLAEAVGAGGKVYAVDIVPRFLKHIQERADRAGLKNVRTVLGTARSAQLPAASIDVVFLCDTYHHFEFPATMMNSVHRALRSGGEVVLIDFKRIPGESSDWVLNHVRAGESVVTAEVEAAGFEKIGEVTLLKDNYYLKFRKREK